MKKRNLALDVFVVFLIVAIFIVLIWLAIKGYPWILGFAIASFIVPFLIILVYSFYLSLKEEKHLQNNYFKLWKKGKSTSLRDGLEYRRIVKSLDDPYVNKLRNKREKIGKICLKLWLAFLLSLLLLIAILQVAGVLKYT